MLDGTKSRWLPRVVFKFHFCLCKLSFRSTYLSAGAALPSWWTSISSRAESLFDKKLGFFSVAWWVATTKPFFILRLE